MIQGVGNGEDLKGIASQVAELLNKNNRLTKRYSWLDVLRSAAVYYPLIAANKVLGSVALERSGYFLSEVKHLVVDDKFRGFGLGAKLVEKVMAKAKTPLLYATIREDNQPSERIFLNLKFRKLAQLYIPHGKVKYAVNFYMRARPNSNELRQLRHLNPGG